MINAQKSLDIIETLNKTIMFHSAMWLLLKINIAINQKQRMK
jgi:hypothetical protein